MQVNLISIVTENLDQQQVDTRCRFPISTRNEKYKILKKKFREKKNSGEKKKKGHLLHLVIYYSNEISIFRLLLGFHGGAGAKNETQLSFYSFLLILAQKYLFINRLMDI